jgi:tetratricopeptide (TPR) repeat protein
MVLVGLVVTTALLAAANERERHAKARAEQNFRLARAAVDRYHTEVSQDDLLNEPGMQPLRKKLLEAAKEFYEKFKSERAGDPTVQAELGKATYRLAQITGDIGSELDAIRLHQEAVHLFETLPTPQADADTRSDLAASYHHLGRLYRLTDQMTLSQGAYLKALTLWEALVKDEPTEDRFQDGLARTQLGLGNFYRLAGKLDAAQDFYRRASEKWAALRHANPKTSSFRRDLAIAQHNLGNLLKTVEGNEADAAKMLRSAQSLQKQLVAEAPNIGQYQSDLAKTDYSLGEYQGAATLWQTLVDRHPAVTEPHKTLAEAYTSLAMMYAQTAPKKAEESCQQALAIKRKLAANHPGVPSYQGELARGLSTLGAVLEWSGPLDKSTTAYKEALAIQDKLVRDLPDVPHYRRDLAHTHNGLGRLYAKHKQAVKADNEHKKALALWQALAKNQRLDLEYRLGECKTCVEIAHLASAEGKYKDAIGWYNQAHTLAPTKMKPAILLPRSAALARSGDYLEATKEAGDLVAKATSGTARYQFAVVYALSAAAVAGDMQRALPERQKLAEQYADAAVKLLISAYEAPAFRTPANLEKLKTDPDLKALRDRPDFKKLLSDRAL